MRPVFFAAGLLAAVGCTPSRYDHDRFVAETQAWLKDKDVVRAEYERCGHTSTSRLGKKFKPFRSSDLAVTVGENGGRTRNFIHVVFRDGAEAREGYFRLHRAAVRTGFNMREGLPRAVAYKVEPGKKKEAAEAIEKALRAIVRRLGAEVPELAGIDGDSIGERGIRYTLVTARYSRHVSLIVHDYSKSMHGRQLSNMGVSTPRIHLPSLGYAMELYVQISDRKANRARFAPPEDVTRIVREELAPVIALDPLAEVSRPAAGPLTPRRGVGPAPASP